MAEHGVDNTQEFMGHGQHGLPISLSLATFPVIKLSKDRIIFYDHNRHQEQDAPQALIAAFRDFSSSFPLPGLPDDRVEAGEGDEFFRIGELSAMGFGQEVSCSHVAQAADGGEEGHGVRCLLAAFPDQPIGHLFQLCGEDVQDSDFGLEDGFISRGREADRGPSGVGQTGEGKRRFSSSARGPDSAKNVGGSLSECVFRGEALQQIQNRKVKRVDKVEDLGEEDVEKTFNFVLGSGDLTGESLAFPRQSPKAFVGLRNGGQTWGVLSKEQGDGRGVALVGFGLAQGEFSEVGDEERIQEPDRKTSILKEGQEIETIDTSRFHPDQGEGGWKEAEKGLKTGPRHHERPRPESLTVIVDEGGMEPVFRDVDAAEASGHGFTSSDKMRMEAGTAARPILQRDKGSRTQPTNEDFGGQGTDLA